MYLEIKGVEGPVTSSGFEGWLKILSAATGISRNFSASSGTVGNKFGPATQEGYQFTTPVDKSIVGLFNAVTKAKNAEMTLVYVDTDENGAEQEVMRHTLHDAGVASFHMSLDNSNPNDDANMLLTFTVYASEVEIAFTPRKVDGSPEAALRGKYNYKTLTA